MQGPTPRVSGSPHIQVRQAAGPPDGKRGAPEPDAGLTAEVLEPVEVPREGTG